LTRRSDDGIVVVEVRKGEGGMAAVSGALLEKLGHEAADELVEVLDVNRCDILEQVGSQCTDRIERRILDESSKLRLDMSQMRMDLRSEIAELRTETREGFATLRGEMARDRFELLKWAFAFWVGQLFAVVGLMALLLRAVHP
jgi:hypothetical protein